MSVELKKIGWENGTLVSKAKVNIDGTIYEVEPAQYSGKAPMSAENLKKMEDNSENAINEATEKNIITAYPTATLSNVSDNTLIKLAESIIVGDKLTLKDNAIVIGKGITKVKVSGSIFFQGLPSNQVYMFPNLKKNNSIFASPIVSKGVTDFQSVVFSTTLIEVTEGDKITMTTGDVNNLKVGVRGNRQATYVTVEVVE